MEAAGGCGPGTRRPRLRCSNGGDPPRPPPRHSRPARPCHALTALTLTAVLLILLTAERSAAAWRPSSRLGTHGRRLLQPSTTNNSSPASTGGAGPPAGNATPGLSSHLPPLGPVEEASGPPSNPAAAEGPPGSADSATDPPGAAAAAPGPNQGLAAQNLSSTSPPAAPPSPPPASTSTAFQPPTAAADPEGPSSTAAPAEEGAVAAPPGPAAAAATAIEEQQQLQLSANAPANYTAPAPIPSPSPVRAVYAAPSPGSPPRSPGPLLPPYHTASVALPPSPLGPMASTSGPSITDGGVGSRAPATAPAQAPPTLAAATDGPGAAAPSPAAYATPDEATTPGPPASADPDNPGTPSSSYRASSAEATDPTADASITALNAPAAAGGVPSTKPSPSPSASPSPGGSSSRGPSPSGTDPPAPYLGSGSPNASSPARCWVAVRDWPARECVEWLDDCSVANASEVERCNVCTKGWGSYPSRAACEADAGYSPSSSGIDPTTYPAPAAPDSACNYNPSSRTRSASSPCPHLLPDVVLWEAASTWPATSTGSTSWGGAAGGGVPAPGSAVVLPSGKRVMITGCSFKGSGANTFASIRIPAGSELIFDDAAISLVVGAIYVGGRLRAGGEGCRVGGPITITFAPASGVPEGDMGIQVMAGGQADLHGTAYYPTWTRLSNTVKRGEDWLSLQDSVSSWRPGQLIFVATSIYRDEYENQNEVATIRSVSADGKTLVLTSTFQYSHYGGPEYQTEVGLLSRSILLRSYAGAAATRRGGHVKVMGQGRFEGVLGFMLGQTNVLGAYPFHWHNAGDASGGVSYAKDCAVYNSYYRCFAIHGTNNLVLSDNVAFHATGSCFYLEDGVEEGNWLSRNLGAFVHVIGVPAGGITQSGETFVQSAGLAHPTDAAAAVFYSANPNNAWKDNAASGGFTGFSFPVLPEPIGDHRWMRSSVVPHQRPLKLFDGNTAHSSGYFYLMAGAIYVGGKLWINDADGGKLYYSSGRWEFDTRDDSGTSLGFMDFTNNKVWLGQWAISHWGARARVVGWEVHDCVRGANVFGLAAIRNAYVNYRSGNADAQYPAGLHDPIAGFRWYDTRVMTILHNVTFANYPYLPEQGVGRPAVWFSMVHSDEYKPGYISASAATTYRNCDSRALVNNPHMETGAGRYFNWIDHDGSATLRGRPSVVGSWPSWWRLGPECSAQQGLWGATFCDFLPWRGVARLDVRVPGFTVPVDVGAAFPPDPAYYMGYVAQFGARGADARNMNVTRNEGITGVAGPGGWYLHLSQGVTPALQVFITQIPPGTSLVFATRYPPGTTFSVSRQFRWYPSASSTVRQAGSLAEVLAGGGDLYWFSGKHLYVKMVDPGDASVDPPFTAGGVTVWGTRYFSAWYWINATSINGQNPYSACSWVSGPTPSTSAPGARFCPMAADPATDIPDALPASYMSWTAPFCTDVAPPGGAANPFASLLTCAQVAAQGLCAHPHVRSPTDPHAAVIGGYCAVSCGRCAQGQLACIDQTPPGGLTCAQRRASGNCAAAWFQGGNWCAATCGYCTPATPLPPQPPAPDSRCTDVPVPPGTYSCAQQLAWGQCSQAWMLANRWCLASCGLCGSLPPAGCVDVTPPGGYTCGQQAAWGKCTADFMKLNNYCAATCGTCSSSGTSPSPSRSPSPSPAASCGDVAPPGGNTCAQQASWGRCNDGFMLPFGFCAATCRRCSGGANCYDVEPPGGYSCAQQAAWGKCGDSFMMLQGYCATTCGRCGSTAGLAASISSISSGTSGVEGAVAEVPAAAGAVQAASAAGDTPLPTAAELAARLAAQAAAALADAKAAAAAALAAAATGGVPSTKPSPTPSPSPSPPPVVAPSPSPSGGPTPSPTRNPSPSPRPSLSPSPGPSPGSSPSPSPVPNAPSNLTDAQAAASNGSFVINPVSVTNASTANGLYRSNASYGLFQTALFVASAASVSTAEFALDTAAARAAAANGSAATPASGTGGVPSSKPGASPSPPSGASPGQGQQGSIGPVTEIITSSPNAATASAGNSSAQIAALDPTQQAAFNAFERTTSVPSPGAPLGAAKPNFYTAWARAAGLAATGYASASVASDEPASLAGSGSGSFDAPYALFYGLPLRPSAAAFIGTNRSAVSTSSGGGGYGGASDEGGDGGGGGVCRACSDTPPAGGRLSCAAVAAQGLCGTDWTVQGHICDGTCGRCSYAEPCMDILPSFVPVRLSGTTGGGCAAVKAAGRCNDTLLTAAGWCRATCSRCNATTAPTATTANGTTPCVAECADLPPPGAASCAVPDAVAAAGGRWCGDPLFVAAGYCARTCGRC
ncbi:hypothetical protein HYH03_017681 [Edaphochlamys debaryana]|uniref:G8 domain-containing protein n=1 Tax=Edaphochlamys debaryana TaxID=47281 RepID=A0A835XLZ4_9CHLO|nr:hypothetical protein HYH03_017681 [Edaphochlamys debaryana]|eukprot:KAG2483425.1 hypothetical protein HYH03_017681 [Edaphochlamys debaryana]